MARKLLMGQKELLRGKLMAQVEAKQITLKAASVQAGSELSAREADFGGIPERRRSGTDSWEPGKAIKPENG